MGRGLAVATEGEDALPAGDEKETQGQPPQGVRTPRALDELRWPGLWAPLVVVVVYIAGALVFGIIGGIISRPLSGSAPGPISSILSWANLLAIATMGLVSLLLLKRANPGESLAGVIGLTGRVERRDWLHIFVLFLVAVPSAMVIAALLTVKFGLTVDPQITDVLTTPVSMVAAVVVAPVGEELWARGLAYGALRRWGPWVAVVGATLVSAGLHYEPVRVFGVIPIMAALSWLRYRTGRLAPCVLLHASYNLFLVGLGVLAGSELG